MLLKLKRMFSITFMMLMLLSIYGFKVSASELSKDYLPEGWTRIETDSLTNEQIESIAKAVSDFATQPKTSAPALTSLDIIDLAVDDNNEIHVVIQEIGTSKSGMRFVYWNGKLCDENLDEMQLLVGTDNIVYGYIRYFHTGVYYTSSLSGTVVNITAKSTNAMSPWNTLSASATFTLP